MSVSNLLEQLETLLRTGLAEIEHAGDDAAIEGWRVDFLGRNGQLARLMKQLGSVSPEERPKAGARANEVKKELEATFAARSDAVRQAARSTAQATALDVTLPGRTPSIGRLHPTTQVVREISDIFVSMGFQTVEGPEVEWDYYNFEALNIPKNHPARDMWDTLWITPNPAEAERPKLLRTHTSPMQIRVMEQHLPPIRVIVPGRVYRYEATDATPESQFFQIEGLAVDRNVTFADLKGTLFEFAKRLFGRDRRVRFRCDYFPFVEPGVDMSIDCFACSGKGCRNCRDSGWIEILGAGMVHPDVLRRVDIDPKVYSGFAFGLGRSASQSLSTASEDIRNFYSNDLRFLRQF